MGPAVAVTKIPRVELRRLSVAQAARPIGSETR